MKAALGALGESEQGSRSETPRPAPGTGQGPRALAAIPAHGHPPPPPLPNQQRTSDRGPGVRPLRRLRPALHEH